MDNINYIKELGRLKTLEVLLYYDGPRLFSCESLSGQLYLALWVEYEQENDRWFYVPISRPRLSNVKRGMMSLQKVFKDPEDGFLWEIRISFLGENYTIERRLPEDLHLEDFPQENAYLHKTDQTLPSLTYDTATFAQRIWKDVLDIALHDDQSTGNDIDCDVLGSVLLSLQNLIRALGNKNGLINTRIFNQWKQQLTLKVTNVFASSFGVRLESSGSSELSNVLQTFISLLSSRDYVKENFNQMEREETYHLESLLTTLLKANLSLSANWANPSGSSSVFLSQKDAAYILKNLEQNYDFVAAHKLAPQDNGIVRLRKTEQISEILTLKGTLLGLNARIRTFEFRSEDGELYKGKWNKDITYISSSVPAEVTIELERRVKIEQRNNPKYILNKIDGIEFFHK